MAYWRHFTTCCAIYLFCCGRVILCIDNMQYISIDNYRLGESGLIQDIDLTRNPRWSKIRCMNACLLTKNCQSVSIKKDKSRCQLYSVSIAAIGSDPVQDNEWNTYVREGWHPIVKYSTGESQYNGLSIPEFYTYEPYTASFPDDNCGIDPAVKCNRPYKHTLKDFLLESNLVKQIKISVYKAGSQVAYAIFTKEPGLQDTWFAGSRLVESYPWDKNLLQEDTALYSFDHSSDIPWLISEGSKYNSAPVGFLTAHANWLIIKSNGLCDSAVTPEILYSKQGGPVLLATHAVAYASKSKIYDISGYEAPSVCSNYLHTTIATKQQGNTAYSNGFSCCRFSWMSNSQSPTGYSAGLWMTTYDVNCGNAGYNQYSNVLSQKYGVLCVVNDAGVADTFVVSVKLGNI